MDIETIISIVLTLTATGIGLVALILLGRRTIEERVKEASSRTLEFRKTIDELDRSRMTIAEQRGEIESLKLKLEERDKKIVDLKEQVKTSEEMLRRLDVAERNMENLRRLVKETLDFIHVLEEKTKREKK